MRRAAAVPGWLLMIVTALWGLAGHLSTAQSVVTWTSLVKPHLQSAWKIATEIQPLWYQLILFILGLAWVGLVANRQERSQPEVPKEAPTKPMPSSTWFLAQGFNWEVLPTFHSQYRSYEPESPMTHATIGHIFQGPYCSNGAHCKMPVADDLLSSARLCSRCGELLEPKIEIKAEGPRHGVVSAASHDPLWPLRRAAFREAIAAVKEGKLTPSGAIPVEPSQAALSKAQPIAQIASPAAPTSSRLTLNRSIPGWSFSGLGYDKRIHTYMRTDIDALTESDRRRLFQEFEGMREWYGRD